MLSFFRPFKKAASILLKVDRKITGLLRFLLLLASLSLFFIGISSDNLNIMTVAVTVLWLHNILFSLQDLKSNFLFFVFHLTFFLFLIGRPLILVLRKQDIMTANALTYESSSGIYIALTVLFVSLLSLFCGALIVGKLCSRPHALSEEKKLIFPFSFIMWIEMHPKPLSSPTLIHIEAKNERLTCRRLVALFIFFGTFLCYLTLQLEKYFYVKSHTYVEGYAYFSSSFPYFVQVSAYLFFFALCFYLSSFPCKSHAFCILSLYIVAQIPELLSGGRMAFCIAILFALIYYVMRDSLGDKKVWVGSFEKLLLLFGSAGSIILLSAITYTRVDIDLPSNNPLALAHNFLFSQGTTFSYLSAALERVTDLRSQGVISYTFGSLIDYLTHNRLGQLLFHTQPLTFTNSVSTATNSSSMAHHLSYLLLGDRYLEGQGTGSSYLLEVYTDFDWIGLVLFGIFLGAFLFGAFRLVRKKPQFILFLLCSLNNLVVMPRGEAFTFPGFLWRIAFWAGFFFWIGLSFLSEHLWHYLPAKLKKLLCFIAQ